MKEDNDAEGGEPPEQPSHEVPPEIEQRLRDEEARHERLLTDLGKTLDKMLRDVEPQSDETEK